MKTQLTGLIRTLFLGSLLIITIFTSAYAQSAYQKGPFKAEHAPMAPEWKISKWMNGPKQSLADLRGRVVVIDFFQLWCPGCNRFSIPLMAAWEKHFEAEIKSGKLALISIHTVFEGHSYQNNKRLASFIKEKNFNHPVGVDYLAPGKRLPSTMIAYNTSGTPEMAFIDRKGRLRFQRFGSFDPNWATGFIRHLLTEAPDGES